MARIRSIAAPVLAGVLLVAAGCGTGPPADTTNSSPATTAATPVVATDAQVTSGLVEVRALAATIAATLPTDQPAAEGLTEDLYDRWHAFESTVRKNDKGLYLQMEDGLAAIKAGAEQNRPDKVDKGIGDLEAGATAYLAKHP